MARGTHSERYLAMVGAEESSACRVRKHVLVAPAQL